MSVEVTKNSLIQQVYLLRETDKNKHTRSFKNMIGAMKII